MGIKIKIKAHSKTAQAFTKYMSDKAAYKKAVTSGNAASILYFNPLRNMGGGQLQNSDKNIEGKIKRRGRKIGYILHALLCVCIIIFLLHPLP